MPQRHKEEAVSARIQQIDTFQLLLVNGRGPKVRQDELESSLELRRRDTKNGEGMLVQSNRAAHHPGIVLKVSMPICVAENQIWSAVGTVLVSAPEETANIRLNP